MNPSSLQRPTSLSMVAANIETYADFGGLLRDFLHAFAEHKRMQRDLSPMLAEEPDLLAQRFAEGPICDAFLAATADQLSRNAGIPTPQWAMSPQRVLEEPWFSEPFHEVRMRLLRDTPSAFKDRNLFVFESALHVA